MVWIHILIHNIFTPPAAPSKFEVQAPIMENSIIVNAKLV